MPAGDLKIFRCLSVKNCFLFLGNILLPPMGFCEIHESTKDLRQTVINHNKFVCEISPNILYQYVLIILWFLIVFSIIVSISGLLINLVGHIVTVTFFLRHDNPAREIYKILTFRECEYLEMIRRSNLPAFGQIVRKLQTQRPNCARDMSFDIPDRATIRHELKTLLKGHAHPNPNHLTEPNAPTKDEVT